MKNSIAVVLGFVFLTTSVAFATNITKAESMVSMQKMTSVESSEFIIRFNADKAKPKPKPKPQPNCGTGSGTVAC